MNGLDLHDVIASSPHRPHLPPFFPLEPERPKCYLGDCGIATFSFSFPIAGQQNDRSFISQVSHASSFLKMIFLQTFVNGAEYAIQGPQPAKKQNKTHPIRTCPRVVEFLLYKNGSVAQRDTSPIDHTSTRCAKRADPKQ